MSYTWVKTFIEDLALQPNGRLRMDCPSCHKKNTLSVTDNGYERMYNCFYADCDVKGVTGKRLTKTNSRMVFEKKSESSIKHTPFFIFKKISLLNILFVSEVRGNKHTCISQFSII